MKQNEKTGKFYVLIAVALLVTSVAVAVSMAQPAPYPGTGPAPTAGPTSAPGPGGGPAPYPTPPPPPPPPPPTPPPGGLPDLVVEAPISIDFITSPGNVIIDFIIHNNGTAAAGSSHATKYLYNSTGALVHVDHAPVDALGVSGRFYGAFAPEPCPPGETFTVRVEADNYHVVAESNEMNNDRTTGVFTCPVAGQQPGGPDLVITKWVEKNVIAPNQCEFRAHYTVTNIGNAVITNFWDVWMAIYNNGTLVEVDQAAGPGDLGPLASYTSEFNWVNCPICGGIRNVTVCVDYYNAVTESNETNNFDTNFVDCRLGDIEVNKTVHDPNIVPPADDKVDEIDAVYGDVVKFNCTVHNIGCCCDLTNITVTDVLSDSLEYINATPAPDIVSIAGGVTTLTWEYKDVTDILEPCEWLNYTINATVIGCGVDTNTQTAVATNCTGGEVTDTDTATVNVAVPDPRINVDKKVKDPVSGNWVDGPTNVAIATDIEYKSTVHNSGCCDLTSGKVWDTLPGGLVYVVGSGNPTPVVTAGANVGETVLTWDIPEPYTHCTTYTYTYTAQAPGAGQYINTQRARGHCATTGTWADDDDAVIVNAA